MATSHKILWHEPVADKIRPIVKTHVVFPGPQSKLQKDTLGTINRAITLISDPHTEQMHERHQLILKQICIMNDKGFKLRDLVSLYKLLHLLADRACRDPETYQLSLINLINLCKFPWIKEKSSDENTFFNLCVDCLSELGYLLRVPNQLIQRTVCHTLDEFYDPIILPDYNFDEHDWRPTTSKFNRAVLEASDIGESLLLVYATLSDLSQPRFCILRLLQKLAIRSEACAQRLVQSGAAKLLAEQVFSPSEHLELISRSTEFLWSLIDHDHDRATIVQWTRQLGDESSLGPLYEALMFVLSQDHSRLIRGLRNDLITLLFLLVKHAEQTNQLSHVRLVETGFVRLFCQLFALKRGRRINPLLKNLKLLPNPENFDFIKLLISTVVLLVHDPVAVRVMARTHLIEALFEWAWLMGMNLVKASKTPRPSIDDNWASTKNRDFSIGLTAAKARIQAASAELSTTSADSNAERPVNHQTDNCGSYFMEARSNTMQTNLEALEKSSDSTDSDGDTTDNRENVEAGQIDLHNVLDSLNVKDKSSTRLNPGKQWPMAYQEEIQLHALDALTACGPLLLDDIIRLDGPNRLIAFLQWCDGSDPFVGQGNSFHGEGGRHNKRAQLRYTLRLIRSLVDTGDERITEDFINQGLISTLVDLTFKVSLRRPSSAPNYHLVSTTESRCNPIRLKSKPVDNVQSMTMIEDDIGIEMQCDILLILAKLCEYDPQRKSMIGVDGIDTLTLLLSSISNRLSRLEPVPCSSWENSKLTESDPALDSEPGVRIRLSAYRKPLINLATALVDAIWCCIIGSVECEDYFLAQNGATSLADLLEWYPRDQRSHLLGCLVDLTENPKCFPYLMSWFGVRPLKPDESQQKLTCLDAVAQLLSRTPDMASTAAMNKLIDSAAASMCASSSPIGEENESAGIENSKGNGQKNKTPNNNEITKWQPVRYGPTLIELLCEFWRSEQTNLSSMPTLSQTRSSGPSGSSSVKSDTPLESNQPSVCTTICDTYQSDGLRLNIYALLLRLGFASDENLSVDDKITLREIERYFDKKNAEVWTQIDQELKNDGVRPITPDEEMVRRIREWDERQQETLKKTERELRDAAENEARRREQEEYNRIREVQRYRHRLEMEFSDYVARTSNVAHLRKAKLRQRSSIRASRIRPTRTTDPARRPFNPTPPTTNTTETVTVVATTTESNTEEEYGTQSSDSAMPEAMVGGRTTTTTTTTTTSVSNEEKSGEYSFDSSTGDGGGSCSTETTYSGTRESRSMHPIEIKNTNVTAFCSRTVVVESTPRVLFANWTDMEKEILKVIP